MGLQFVFNDVKSKVDDTLGRDYYNYLNKK